MTEVMRTERGWGGHFCAANRCAFRRNTLLELGDLRVIVSSVGAMRDGHKPVETIGCDRYYETMVFHAQWDDPYWDADVSRVIYFDAPGGIGHCEFSADGKANDMHEAVVREITEKMLTGAITN